MNSSISKYKLAICELFNPYFHGFDYHSDETVKSSFLVFETIDRESFFNNDYKISLRYLFRLYKNMVSNSQNGINNLNHPIIENYSDIIKKRSYYNIDIVETNILTGQEMVAYKKTFWLKIFQRKWKNQYYKYYLAGLQKVDYC